MYLNCTNMHPLGFNGLIGCRLLIIFEPGVCPVWIMWLGGGREVRIRMRCWDENERL